MVIRRLQDKDDNNVSAESIVVQLKKVRSALSFLSLNLYNGSINLRYLQAFCLSSSEPVVGIEVRSCYG